MLEDVILRNCLPLKPLPAATKPKLNRLENVKAVLFDVYGTLLISGSGDVGTATATDTAEALEQSLAAAGFTGDLTLAGRSGKDLLKSAVLAWHQESKARGIDCPEVEIRSIWKTVLGTLHAEKLLFAPGTDEQIERFAVEYECRVNPTWPMPAARETIKAIQKSGKVLGIVSNAQFYTPLLFSAFFGQPVDALGFAPDACVWSYKEMKAKPSAGLFPKAEEFLRETHGISPREIVYIGNDMLNDVYTAREAGCRTVLFAGDRRSLRLRENDPRCLAIRPDAVVTSLTQLLEII
jgi:putative hydrolase of the HAD superfamily